MLVSPGEMSGLELALTALVSLLAGMLLGIYFRLGGIRVSF